MGMPAPERKFPLDSLGFPAGAGDKELFEAAEPLLDRMGKVRTFISK